MLSEPNDMAKLVSQTEWLLLINLYFCILGLVIRRFYANRKSVYPTAFTTKIRTTTSSRNGSIPTRNLIRIFIPVHRIWVSHDWHAPTSTQ